MADMVRRDSTSQGCREKAIEVCKKAGVDGHDPEGVARALFYYARDGVTYFKDPVDVEWVQGNADEFRGLRTIDTEVGDCDDKVTLLASLLGASGIKSRFV